MSPRSSAAAQSTPETDAPVRTPRPRTRKAAVAVVPDARAKAPARGKASDEADEKSFDGEEALDDELEEVEPEELEEDEEVTVEEAVTPGNLDVKFEREGNDVILTVGGKKRSLDDVDDAGFEPAEEAKTEQELTEDQGFSLSDADDADEPEQQVLAAGAT
ncbi:MAG: RNA polymerase sigma factor, partial [Propionicimonas sp.]|nr:RNA polymerase sigma factor [Propionicimonas sp.]